MAPTRFPLLAIALALFRTYFFRKQYTTLGNPSKEIAHSPRLLAVDAAGADSNGFPKQCLLKSKGIDPQLLQAKQAATTRLRTAVIRVWRISSLL
jgi:hypothetical protein